MKTLEQEDPDDNAAAQDATGLPPRTRSVRACEQQLARVLAKRGDTIHAWAERHGIPEVAPTVEEMAADEVPICHNAYLGAAAADEASAAYVASVVASREAEAVQHREPAKALRKINERARVEHDAAMALLTGREVDARKKLARRDRITAELCRDLRRSSAATGQSVTKIAGSRRRERAATAVVRRVMRSQWRTAPPPTDDDIHSLTVPFRPLSRFTFPTHHKAWSGFASAHTSARRSLALNTEAA